MADEIIGAKIDIDTGPVIAVTKTVGELRVELSLAQEAAKFLTEKFGEGSDKLDSNRAKIEAITKQLTAAGFEAGGVKEQVAGVGTETDKTSDKVASLRTQFREALANVDEMRQKFGATSDEATKAAQAAGALRERIQDAKLAADAFNPNARFAAVAGSVRGIVGAFTGLQGAIALTGVKSEEVQQTLLKVQGALALSQGVNSVLLSIKSFENLAAVIKSTAAFQAVYNAATAIATAVTGAFGIAVDTTSVSFAVLRGAIISTGIGALVVALGFVISKIVDFATATDKATEAQKLFNDEIIKNSKQQTDAILANIDQQEKLNLSRSKAARDDAKEQAAISKQADADRLAALKTHLAQISKQIDDNNNNTKQKEEDRFAESTKLTQEYFAIKDAINKQEVAGEIEKNEDLYAIRKQKEQEDKKAAAAAKSAAAAARAARKAELAAEREAFREGEADKAQINEHYNALIAGDEDDAREKAITAETKFYTDSQLKHIGDASYQQEIEEKYRQAIQAINDKYDALDDKKEAEEFAKQSALDKKHFAEQSHDETEGRKKKFEDLKNYLSAQRMAIYQDAKLTEEDRTEALRTNSEARKKIDQEETDAKTKSLEAVGTALDQFSELLGKQTAAGKVLAIASATISTIESAVKSYNALAGIPIVGPALGALAAAGAIAAGIARVNAIVAVQVPGGSGGGSSASLSGVGNAGAPLAPSSPLATPTTLDQSTINRLGNSAVKTYVVESDISSSQKRVTRILNGARIR